MGSEPDFRFFLVSGADPDFSEATMARTIIVDGGEKIACPKCNHGFPLSEGISRQTIERYAEDFERSVASHRKKLEAELAAEAKAQFDSQRKALNEALGAKEGALARFRSEELQLRRQLASWRRRTRTATSTTSGAWMRSAGASRRSSRPRSNPRSAKPPTSSASSSRARSSSRAKRLSSPSKRCCATPSRSTRSCPSPRA